jgi:hypothetical protein
MAAAEQNPLAEALRQLEESNDRLLLTQTRMTMATERAERAVGALSAALTDLDHRVRRPDRSAD